MANSLTPSFIYTPPHAPYFSVIHMDASVIVLDKPAGLLTVPGKAPEHADCLEARVQSAFPEARIVHRLDMDTSGLCIMGLTAEAHRNLSMQFERRKTAKMYVARVWGALPGADGVVDLPLVCDWPNRPKQIVDHKSGRPALTRWQVIEQDENTSRVRLFPVTGRSHQLRVHMLSLGCPILGDRFYAHGEAVSSADRMLLHAAKLTVHHPADGARMTFTSLCPF